jgi:hypothetical protein
VRGARTWRQSSWSGALTGGSYSTATEARTARRCTRLHAACCMSSLLAYQHGSCGRRCTRLHAACCACKYTSTRSVRSRASHVARRCIAAHSDTADSTATLACTFEGSMVHGARCMLHTMHALHIAYVARCTRCGTRLAATLGGLLLSSSAPTVGNSTIVYCGRAEVNSMAA